MQPSISRASSSLYLPIKSLITGNHWALSVSMKESNSMISLSQIPNYIWRIDRT